MYVMFIIGAQWKGILLNLDRTKVSEAFPDKSEKGWWKKRERMFQLGN